MDLLEHGSNGTGSTNAVGVIGGGARMLRELLRTPRVVKTMRIALSNLDPQAAPELVRTVLFGDTVLFFDLVSATPDLANAAILGQREAATQLIEMPEELVDRFLPQLLEEVSAEGLGEGAALASLAALRLVGRKNPALATKLTTFEQKFARGWQKALKERESQGGELADAAVTTVLGAADRAAGHLDAALDDDSPLTKAVTRLVEGIRQLAADHPRTMNRLVKPLANAGREALEG